MMLHRPDMAADVTRLPVPVLMLAACGDGMGAGPADAKAVASKMPEARVGTIAGTGHVTPLLIDSETVCRSIVESWRNRPR